jgi:hypothetical protein
VRIVLDTNVALSALLADYIDAVDLVTPAFAWTDTYRLIRSVICECLCLPLQPRL